MKPFESATASAFLEDVMDSIRAFEHIGQDVKTYGLYTYGAQRAIARRQLATALRRQIVEAGVKLETPSTFLGEMRRIMFKVRARMRRSKLATVQHLDRVESALLARVELTLATVDLAAPIAETIRLLQACIIESRLELVRLGAAARSKDFLSR